MGGSFEKRLEFIADTSQLQRFRPDARPWPRLLCFTAALMASGGMWVGLIALARHLFG